MKKTLFATLFSFITFLAADPLKYDLYENLDVEKITVEIKNASPSNKNADSNVLIEMHLKSGDKFSQAEFDKDLKDLSNKYQIVDPTITKRDGKLFIHLDVTLRPIIVKFTVNGSSYTAKKILDKGSLKSPMEYNRQEFYQSITDIRDFLIKRGYFKADVSYKIEETPGTGEAVAHIFINQGMLGHIRNIKFKNFSKKEEKAIYGMIKSSRFHILTNWIIGSGVLKEEDVERDAQVITHYIQNEGYVDAKVNVEITKAPRDKVNLNITLDRGELYHVGKVEIQGNTLETNEAIDNALTLKKGDIFSTEKVFKTQETIKSLYTKKGYLDTSVNYELVPARGHKYNIVYTVEESDRYKVGLIVVSGNTRTNNNVIYNNIKIAPGDVFDTSKMKVTQQRLQSTGYFKNVSVYAVKSDHLDGPDSQYRDVRIEVEENRTGAFHLSAGANSTQEMFGELSISENNFDINGLVNVWTEGPKSLRGGGQFIDVKGMVTAKEISGTVNWINPYIQDSLWRLGIDILGKKDSTISPDYDLYSAGGGVSMLYPINSYLSGGVKTRIKDSIIRLHNMGAVIEQKQENNSGVVAGGALVLGYNSTNNPFNPSRGLRSNFEAEFAGLVRQSDSIQDFPFLKLNYLNSYYFSLWNSGTFKIRGDLKFIKPLWNGSSDGLPLTEKFFLGGIGTLRGYAPGQIGPAFSEGNPSGGISSQLFSFEFLQNIIQPLDAFAFFDAGAINANPFDISSKKYMSVGVGIRLHIGQAVPFVIGWGYPLNVDQINGQPNEAQIQNVFYSMSGGF